jgi:hypothetical protein
MYMGAPAPAQTLLLLLCRHLIFIAEMLGDSVNILYLCKALTSENGINNASCKIAIPMDENLKEYHRMGRRSQHKNYKLPGVYHVTISVNRDLQRPLGSVVGRLEAADGSSEAPRVELSALGAMVEYELTHSISRYYPMIEVQDHIVMPEHLHALIVVKNSIISANGRETHLGQVIAGFKKGCNRRYWEMVGLRGEPADAGKPKSTSAGKVESTEGAGSAGRPEGAGAQRFAVLPQRIKRTPSTGTTGRPPLFADGYVDVMPIEPGQLEQQRQYIHDNPRSRLLRSANRAVLQAQRMSITTAISVRALRRYLEQVCLPSQITEETWRYLQDRLLIKDGMVACDSYGSLDIMAKRMLPVVHHRKDAGLFERQRQRCLAAAADGVALVSARIAKGEQAIMDEVRDRRYPEVLIADNGFPELYHPSKEKIALCQEGRLLLVTPWKYRYRGADESISVAECKAMNCVAQALCRLRDDWWKAESLAG